MWSLEALWRASSPSRTEWRVFHGEMTMECRIVNVSGGTEIRYVFRGQPYHSFIHRTRADAQDEARRKLAELIERGWSEGAREAAFAHA
jgi:hypothetical protein